MDTDLPLLLMKQEDLLARVVSLKSQLDIQTMMLKEIISLLGAVSVKLT